MSSTIDVMVAFVVHAKTLQTYCLAWRVRVACQTRYSKIRGRKGCEGTENCSETPRHQTVSVSDCLQRTVLVTRNKGYVIDRNGFFFLFQHVQGKEEGDKNYVFLINHHFGLRGISRPELLFFKRELGVHYL